MTSSREEMLDLIVRWEEARGRGQSPDLEEICQACPERLDELRKHLETLGHAAWLDEVITATNASAPPFDAKGHPPIDLPRVLGSRYRLETFVGMGGFAWVYQGFDVWLERPVAVKIPRIDRPVTGEEVDQCRLEAKKVAKLRHPHIVPVHDVGRDGASCFIVSEWIDGENLASRLKSGTIPPAEAGRIVAEIADALQYAHARGYVHRDVKPANILIDTTGQAYLTDFGIAGLEEELSGDDGHAGTLPYMAPELLARDPSIDSRVDLYALGVVLYELLAGRRPFEAPTPAELRERILAGNPARPSSLQPDVPAPLEAICLRAMSLRPEDRYQGAEAMLADLRSNP
ncbi:serine/threonine-protein kinase [Singulisphaera sp. PoT]|uniref:serine/threonine-protein kinase n=1 Tax=Singulisphaera sp. PoT TaxID=3411797 RepID=UPI003BF5828A